VFFFNLSLGEFLALFAAASGVATLLYLLDRSRAKVKVATLRFWQPAPVPTEQRQRKRIQQPWSLLLQILSMGLLLLAIAQLKWGARETNSRDHVLVMDTSAWMAARIGRITYLDQAKLAAKAWLDTLPAADRVMLLRADAVPTPVTAFESKRDVIRKAIDETRSTGAALRLGAALDQAAWIQKSAGRTAGEVVYAGASRVTGDEALPAAKNFRLLPVKGRIDNAGLRRMSVRRSAKDSELWEAIVTVRNYGGVARAVPLEVRFAGAAVAAARRLTLAPNAEQEVTFAYRTRAAGLLEARLLAADGFAEDDRAILELPAQPVLKVHVCTPEPALWRPLLEANPALQAAYFAAGTTPAAGRDDVFIYDRCAAPGAPRRAIVIGGTSAAGAKMSPAGAKLRWRPESPLADGIRSQDTVLDAVPVIAQAGAVPVAETSAGPVIAVTGDVVMMAFHPLRSPLRYELATPILFANIFRWLAPDSFRQSEVAGASVGTLTAVLDDEAAPVTLTNERGEKLPFARTGKTIRFFAGAPGSIRLNDGKRESVYSLTLPEVGEREIEWPKGTRRGVPAVSRFGAASRELWYALAVLGALGLIADWFLFGLGRRLRPLARVARQTA
jgi:hypothetical protein